MSTISCTRCAETLVDPTRPCEFCRGERIEGAVRSLIAAAKSTCNASLAARADAIDTLRSLGFDPSAVLHARARALDGHAAGDIVRGLVDGRELVGGGAR